jgi:hypothetical protein
MPLAEIGPEPRDMARTHRHAGLPRRHRSGQLFHDAYVLAGEGDRLRHAG